MSCRQTGFSTKGMIDHHLPGTIGLELHLAPAAENERKHYIFNTMFFSATEVAVSIAKFYVRRGKNREALPVLLRTINNPTMAKEAEHRRMIDLLLFQVYLALGNTVLQCFTIPAIQNSRIPFSTLKS